MFDFRYHVASLAAVFVALIIGILVGVGLSGQGFVTDSERDKLEGDITGLDAERDRADALERGQQAGADFAEDAYPVLAAGRLRGRRVSLVVVGSLSDADVVDEVREAVGDAGGRIVRTHALRVPLDGEVPERTLQLPPAP